MLQSVVRYNVKTPADALLNMTGFLLILAAQVNLLDSTDNCGGCNTTCPAASDLPNTASVNCTAGQCAMEECLTGFGDCDNNITTGCEVRAAR